ncbi:MAG: NAD-dependent deacylase [Anaerolineales bacterium]|nr:NAD-dependent deacylase [Anaerolineales bacterium]
MTTRPQDTAFNRAVDLIKNAQHAVVLTGAGSSTSSGIPDFRSAGSGLWTRFLPMEVASLSSFRYHPERFFEWLRPLASHMLNAQPNPAHVALAQLENGGFIRTIITQNIDGLHQRAGSKHVLEVHGTLNTLTCVGCYHQYPSSDFIGAYIEHGDIPRCPDCECILKPDAVLFEEQLPAKIWLEARQASENCDLMLVAGSSLAVMPVAGLPAKARENGSDIIVINKSETYVDGQASAVLTGDVADIIPSLAAEILND